MTTSDMDPRIGRFLADGPSRTPERTIEAALAHARAHPRRRDSLRALRPDPMGVPWFGASPVARSLVLVALLAALLGASLAVAAVGGLLDRPAVVVPEPTTIVEPSPSVDPTPVAITVDLEERYGADAIIDIGDASGTVTGATSGSPSDGGSVPTGEVLVAAVDGDPRSAALTWTGLPCTTLHELRIAPDGRSMTLTEPACEGDTIPRDLVLVLTFADAVDRATLDVTLAPATQP